MTDEQQQEVDMVAETRFKHRGEWLKAGDPFTTDRDNADDLVAMHMARATTILGKMAQALDSAIDTFKKPTPRRQQYGRRDVKATEEET